MTKSVAEGEVVALNLKRFRNHHINETGKDPEVFVLGAEDYDNFLLWFKTDPNIINTYGPDAYNPSLMNHDSLMYMGIRVIRGRK